MFSYFISRAVDKNTYRGSLGYVVPLSFACGSRYEITRLKIYKNYERLYSSHYSIRPVKIFPGIDQRVTIFIAENKNYSADCGVYSSRLWRFNYGDKEKVVMQPQLGYIGRMDQGLLPKTAGEIGAKIYQRILSLPNQLGSLVLDIGNFDAYYHSIARYWIKAYDFKPYFSREGDNTASMSSTISRMFFSSELDKLVFLLLINSSLFYYWWIARGDEFHVLYSEISEFRFGDYEYFALNKDKCNDLVDKLMHSYKDNAQRKTGIAGGKKIIYDEFYPRKSIDIIHQIDDFLAPSYKFTEEQLAFIKNYDIDFRTD